VDPTPSSTQRQADASASTTPKQADPTPSSTQRQADVSATSTPKQADPTPSSTLTPKQADASASATPKQVDASMSGTATPIKPDQSPRISPRPSIYPRQTFNLLLKNSNNTLIRSSPKLQELQTAIACIVQTPLENIEITTITAGSMSLPFTKPQGTGTPVCNSGSSRVLYRQRRLQASGDTTVSVDVLNSPYISQATLQNDPNIMFFMTSVGASGQVASAPASAPVATPNNTGAIYGGVIGSLCAVGIAAYGVMYIRSQRARRPVSRISSKPKTETTVNPFAPNNRISYSPAVVKISRSNSV
jgi:hypothetical protein